MKRALFIPVVLLLISCSASRPTDEQLAAADYGAFPENYRDLVRGWIEENYGLMVQSGIRDLRIQPPAKGYMPGGTDYTFGYTVEVSFSRQTGSGRSARTARTLATLLIRNGSIADWREERQ